MAGKQATPAGRARAIATRLARWVAVPLVTIVAASFALFVALSLAPGDPVYQILGGRGTQEQYDALRAELGLDQPLLVRYWDWLTAAVHGDFGRSFTYKESVSSLLEPRIGITLSLALYAGFLIIVAGVALGVVGGATRKAGPAVAAVSGLGIAIPAFVAAQLLIATLAVNLGWFPVLGAGESGWDRIWHLTLPAHRTVHRVRRIRSAGDARGGVRGAGQHPCRDRPRPGARLRPGSSGGMSCVTRRFPSRPCRRSRSRVCSPEPSSWSTPSASAASGSLLVQSVASKDYNVVLAISLILLVVFVLATTLIDLVQWLLDHASVREEGHHDRDLGERRSATPSRLLDSSWPGSSRGCRCDRHRAGRAARVARPTAQPVRPRRRRHPVGQPGSVGGASAGH